MRAPRCSVRWVPACQTFMRWPRRGGSGSRDPSYFGAPQPTTRGQRNAGNGTDGTRLRAKCVPARGSSGDHLLEEAVLVDLAEERALVEQLGLGAAGDDPAVVEHDDLVGEGDGGEAVGDDDRRP